MNSLSLENGTLWPVPIVADKDGNLMAHTLRHNPRRLSREEELHVASCLDAYLKVSGMTVSKFKRWRNSINTAVADVVEPTKETK